jgi:hypothetical protein
VQPGRDPTCRVDALRATLSRTQERSTPPPHLPLLPRSTEATEIQKVRMAEDAVATRDPERAAGAHMEDRPAAALAESDDRIAETFGFCNLKGC